MAVVMKAKLMVQVECDVEAVSAAAGVHALEALLPKNGSDADGNSFSNVKVTQVIYVSEAEIVKKV